MPKDTLYCALLLSPLKPDGPNKCIPSRRCMNNAQGWFAFASDAEGRGLWIHPYLFCKHAEFSPLEGLEGDKMGQILLLMGFCRGGDTLVSSMEVLVESLPPDAAGKTVVSGRWMQTYTGNLLINMSLFFAFYSPIYTLEM